jgi:exodeoxyribonuclease V alpha subunit
VSTARLPEHETVYAMTVHKSQGSEFDQVLLLLGSTPSDHLTRESLYTGITRGRSRVDIVGSRDVFRAAAERRVERRSGLADALRGGTGPP